MGGKAICHAVLASAVLSAAVPAGAGAATVRMDGGTLRYEAGAGERNQVTITRAAASWQIDDSTVDLGAESAVPLTATGPECVLATSGVAFCAAAPGGQARVELGDGADWARMVSSGPVAQAFSIFGGDGDDQLQGADGADVIDAGAGLDSVEAHGGDDVVLPGADLVRDTVDFGAGTDTVSYAGSGIGMSVTLGEFGEAEAAGSEKEDTLFSVESGVGGNGDDTFVGTAADDRITGGDGADTLIGLDGSDDLRGEGGDDTLQGGGDRDFLDGGTGSDSADGGDADDNVWGSAGDDTLDGGAGADTVHGDAGDDTLFGSDGDDYISAGGGVNILDGGLGADDLIAWGGSTDTVTYAGRTAPVTVTVTDTTGALPPRDDGEAGENDNVIGAETVIGGAGDDSLTGTAAANALVGGAGSDTLDGGDGDDSLDGGSGADAFSGGAGDDSVSARDGAHEDVACGDGADSVVADPRDRPGKDCEKVLRGR